jgi:hypothetical protein
MPTALRARFPPGESRVARAPCVAEAARLLAEVREPAAQAAGR